MPFPSHTYSVNTFSSPCPLRSTPSPFFLQLTVPPLPSPFSRSSSAGGCTYVELPNSKESPWMSRTLSPPSHASTSGVWCSSTCRRIAASEWTRTRRSWLNLETRSACRFLAGRSPKRFLRAMVWWPGSGKLRSINQPWERGGASCFLCKSLPNNINTTHKGRCQVNVS